MAENYSFFNAELSNGNYDRTYTASDLAEYFKSFVTNGVYSVGTNLAVAANGMGVKVGVGKAFINGYFYDNTAELPLSLEVADGAQARIDRVVVRLDLTNRYVKCFVKTGAAAAVPVAPELTRTSSVWELALADIAVAAGATSIADSVITDKRVDSALCGLVGAAGEGTAAAVAQTALTTAESAINSVSNKNYLDNSDFTNPVNQRGAVAPFASGYCIDRWIWSSTTGGRCSLSSEGIVISNGGGTLTQKLENSIGNSFTASIGLVDGVASVVYDDASKTFIITCYGNATISWAKLEKGSIATPYVPKGYGTELYECRRYYQENRQTITLTYLGADNVEIANFCFNPPMRAIPTLAAIGIYGSIFFENASVTGVQLSNRQTWNTGYNYCMGITASADL